MDLYTLSSIFNLMSTLYKMKIGSQVVDDNNQFNMEKTGNPLKFVENSPKYSDIRCLIVSYFNKIDQRYDELSLNLNSMMKEKDKIAQNRQNTTQAQ